ncbi:M56 family metallopeptidase [Sphingomonas sp.]|uniref:M56 family metallopeptidase n=1 Tax=Sphingomonas sp. TaxID=28214 RepID=UPI003B3B7098
MIGWTIEALMASTVLMLVVLALRRPVAARFGAHAAYMLWLLPALRMVLPRLPEMPEPARVVPIHLDVARLIAAGSGVPANPAPVTVAPSIDWLPIVLAFWLAGALGYLGWHWIRHLHFMRTALAHGESSGRRDGINICRSAAVAGPLATGMFHRHILLPPDFDRRYNDAEQQLALAHEMAHHRRGDLIANNAALVTLALHWFNPVAHIAYRAFRADQELACDATVLQRAPSARSDYGRALIKSARAGLPAVACALGPAAQLKRRIEMIARATDNRSWRLFGSGLAIAVIGIGLGLTASGSIAAPSRVAPAPVKTLLLTTSAAPLRPVAVVIPTSYQRPSTSGNQDRWRDMPAPEAAPLPPEAATPPAPPVALQAPQPPMPPMPPATSWRLSAKEARQIREAGMQAGEAARRATAHIVDAAAITREAMAQTRMELARECTHARPAPMHESDQEAIARLSAGCVDYAAINREVQDALREAADAIRDTEDLSDEARMRAIEEIDRARAETARRLTR